MGNTILWAAFIIGIVFIFALDMGVLNRKAHAITFKEAAIWSAVWVSLALLFAVGVFVYRGKNDGLQFLTGYVIELSLSVDNVFLFAVIFNYFQVPPKYQHRVLFWGVLTAVILRGIMILAGAALINRFHWMIWVFGGFLILTGIKMFLNRNEEADVSNNKLVIWLRQKFRFTQEYDGQKFFTLRNGQRYATPLLLVLALVESTDVLFALDSIPAIFAITTDPFIVFTSNILAILGLRSLYFMLAGVMELFHYLSVGLSFVLAFVGVKMVSQEFFHIPIGISLLVIAGIIGGSIVASILHARRHPQPEEAPALAEEESGSIATD